jgi:O-antigen/teichoic acid export membrane protein
LSHQHSSQFLRGLLTLTLSRYLVRALSMVKGLLVARLLGPELYGLFGLLVVFFGYSAYADLGLFGGLTKTLPVHLARGEEDRMRRAERVGLGGVTVFTTLFTVALFLLLWRRGTATVPTLLALSLGMVAQQFFKQITVLLRARNRIGEAAFAFSLVQFFDILFVLALVMPFRVTGVFLGQALAFVAATLVLVRRSRFSLRMSWDSRLVAQLVGSGFPLVISTITFLMLQTVDRLLIAGYSDKIALGHYMIGVFCASTVYYIPQSLEYVLFPSFREKLAGLAPGELPPSRYIEFPTRMLSYVLPPFTAAIFLGIPVVGLLLPDYIPGLESARILVMGTFFLSLVSSATSFLIAADRHWTLMRVQVGAVLLDFGLVWAALHAGRGIAGVAAATAVSYFAYATAALILAYRYLRFDAKGIPRRLLALYLPFAYTLAAALAVSRWSLLDVGNVIGTVALREVAFLIGLAPGLWLLERTTGAVSEMVSMLRGAARS